MFNAEKELPVDRFELFFCDAILEKGAFQCWQNQIEQVFFLCLGSKLNFKKYSELVQTP